MQAMRRMCAVQVAETARTEFCRALCVQWLRLLLLTLIFLPQAPPMLAAEAPTLRFGGSSWYPPFHYPLAEASRLVTDGAAGGFDVAVLDEIARRAGFAVEHRFGDWNEIQQALAAGDIDIVPMFVSDARAQRYLFSDPISIEYHQLFGLEAGSSLQSIEELAGLRVATERASFAGAVLQERSIGATLVETASEAEALHAVLRGEADLALIPATVGLYTRDTEALTQLSVLSPPLLPVTYAFAITQGRSDVLQVVNTQLAAMQRDGTLQALRAAWLAQPVDSGAAWPVRLAWGLAAALALGLVLLALRAQQRSLRRRRLIAAGATTPDPMMELDVGATELLEDLRVTLQQRGLHWLFQPQVSAARQCVVGAEMLVRWEHDAHGLIPPDRFIGLAERSGLIRDLTNQAIDEARAVLVQWQRAGLDCSLSLNVSANDFADAAILAHLIEAMRGFERRLILEITETALMRDMQSILRAVDVLKAANIRLSLDDYGTGYSSMAYLREFNFDEIKIDRSFTRGILVDKRNLMLTRASTQLGHELGAQVVAEGVEDMETAGKLVELGCDLLQGYVFARPLPLEAFNHFACSAPIVLPAGAGAGAAR